MQSIEIIPFRSKATEKYRTFWTNWGRVSDGGTLESLPSNRGRKPPVGVAKRRVAGVEKSGNRTHCGVREE